MELPSKVNNLFEARYALAADLLERIKEQRETIFGLHAHFCKLEADLVYRFYHQSFKVFIAADLVKHALALFEQLAPGEKQLNSWFRSIAEKAASKSFDPDKTNQNWPEETQPILEGFWHCKYFLEQMIESADQLKTAQEILPSGWAAVLYLYNLR